MDTDVDDTAAPSSSAKILRYLETEVPDSCLTILSRALLICGEASETVVTDLLAASFLNLGRWASQLSTEAGAYQTPGLHAYARHYQGTPL